MYIDTKWIHRVCKQKFFSKMEEFQPSLQINVSSIELKKFDFLRVTEFLASAEDILNEDFEVINDFQHSF